MKFQHQTSSQAGENDNDEPASTSLHSYASGLKEPLSAAMPQSQHASPTEDTARVESRYSSRADAGDIEVPDRYALSSAAAAPDAPSTSDVTADVTTQKSRVSTRAPRAGWLRVIVMKIPLRVLTAMLGIPLVLLVVWSGGALLTGVTVFLSLVAMRELIVAGRRNKTPLVIEWSYFLLLFVMVSLWHTVPLWRETELANIETRMPPFASLLQLAWPLLATLLVPLWLLLWGVFLYAKQRVTLSSIALTTLAVNYVALFSFWPMLRDAPNGLSLFILLLAGVWTGDTAAYYVGRALGKRRLTALSPGKTREGVFAGFLATLLVGLLVAGALGLEPIHGVAIGALIAVFAPLGDLVESLWKRELGTKDFGSILPGHGGVLDRCDSLLLAAPAVFIYAVWQRL